MTPDESKSLQALVGSLHSEVHDLVEKIPDVYISKVEVRQIRRRLRMGIITNLVLGVFVVVFFVAMWNVDRSDRGHFREEAIATDQAFCTLTNRTFGEINKNRQSLRNAYGLLLPAPDADPEAAARLDKFREDLLATIDGDLPQLDCSGIGNGALDFSIQDAIRNHTTTPPATAVRPPTG